MFFQTQRSMFCASILPQALAVVSLAALSLLSSHALAAVPKAPREAPLAGTPKLLGRVPAGERVRFLMALPLRDQSGLKTLLARLYNPRDPLHGRFLKPAAFRDRFSPTQADYAAVASYAASHGFTEFKTQPTRTWIGLTGSVPAVEAAFGVHLLQYKAADGRLFHAPDADPKVPAELGSRVMAVIGLDSGITLHSHLIRRDTLHPSAQFANPPSPQGSGPNGGYTPSDIKTAYNLNGTSLDGTG